mmetsp:Transcript_79828/g.205357  ORF Transcript_79828/g.205357 Transcript_79828/m.205357 type:complete len:246 (-) Transcript_79828:9-746(-)
MLVALTDKQATSPPASWTAAGGAVNGKPSQVDGPASAAARRRGAGRHPRLDLTREALERLADIVRVARACLQELHAELLGQSLALLALNDALGVEIALVAHQQPIAAVASILLDLLHPAPDVLEGGAVGDVVDHDDALRAPVVAAGDGPKALLPSSVPEGHLHHLVLDGARAQLEVHADRRHGVLPVVVVREAEQQVRLAHAGVPDQEDLEEQVVVGGRRRHHRCRLVCRSWCWWWCCCWIPASP